MTSKFGARCQGQSARGGYFACPRDEWAASAAGSRISDASFNTGWIGVANIKWVGRIEVSEKPLFSAWNTDMYVLIGPDYEPEPPSKGPVLSNQDLKSALELPWGGEVSGARRLFRGRSWSPFGKIAKAEYSMDESKSWQMARLREPTIAAAPLGFLTGNPSWEPKPGKHIIRVRATDEKGNTQPDKVPFNQQGYLYNAMVEHPVEVR